MTAVCDRDPEMDTAHTICPADILGNGIMVS